MCTGCVCGGRSPDHFPMDGVIAIGFGCAMVTRDGRVVYDEITTERKHVAEKGEDTKEWPPFWTGQDAENAASTDPEHEWRITIAGPMSGGVWRRFGPGVWPLVEELGGFA